MQNIVALQARESFLIFHMDATFKLSDLGYPVITCGFTDRTRSYQLAALFIVSQRTKREYYEAIGAFVRLFRKHMNLSIRVDAVMGDAEDAQVNGLGEIREFAARPYLMCFFHVLYNVRKRIRHLPDSTKDTFCLSGQGFAGSGKGMEDSWLRSRYWRWQIYHSPGGYATTNNPCEVFNASIKRYTLRKASDTRRLILKMLTIAEDYSLCISPTQASTEVPPPQEAKRLARTLVTTNRVAVYATCEQYVVRVMYLGDESIEATNSQSIDDLSEVKVPNNAEPIHLYSLESLTDSEKCQQILSIGCQMGGTTRAPYWNAAKWLGCQHKFIQMLVSILQEISFLCARYLWTGSL
ncbi:LOW QUALITY PROTEIN: hypothetical protein PHMEG_00022388 [Phytophthora megakarya]|uniref:MULE transposase domain-containing protein n=1 Tax=Phytophthora megakarya TaxID=4795 RepID=A0A225VK94_9STRA|nr:LOW QUALITY PROTEIN: hypothetical protein PHMEG_00022388 [Phytophthora megakarya]